jgi:AraC-like DNA-binding protein
LARRGFTSKDAALTINYLGFVYRTLLAEGYSVESLLKDTGLAHDSLSDPDFRCTFEQYKVFVANAVAVTEDVHLGFHIGARFNPINVGLPATAAMSSDLFATALDVLQKFISVNFPTLSLDVLKEPGKVLLRWHPTVDFQETEYFLIGSALMVTENLLKLLLQKDQVTEYAEMMVAKPEQWAEFSNASFPVSFDAPFNQLVFSDSYLSQPLPGTDSIAHKNFLRLCEQQMADAFFEQGITAQVRGVIVKHHYHSVTIETAATELGMSERNLRRQLSQSGTSYKKVVDDVRAARARELLKVAGLPISNIAYDLGFTDPSNFARSFKRWVGMSPLEYREQGQV